MLLIHGEIRTMEGTDYQDGYLWIEGTKIKEIGSMDACPTIEDEVIDLQNAKVFPGFIDAHSHLGMWEDSLNFEGDDGNESTNPITPQMRAIDAINPMDRCFEEAREGGVTTVLTGPGSANPVSGSWCALKTVGRRVDDMLINPFVGMKFAMGENPKSVYNGRNETPVTRMGTAALIREELKKADRYRQDLEKSKVDPDTDPPEYDAKNEALLPVLEGRMKAFFHAHRADDVFTAVRIGKEFHLDYVIVHGTEGHLIADLLQEDDVKVITGPLLTDRSKPELKNATIANPAVLDQNGVVAAICTDHPVIPIQYLPLCAGLAVKGGLSYDKALEMITILPAKIAGIADRVGSLKPGKDADIVVYTDDPLAVTAVPKLVLIDGKIVFRKSEKIG